MKSIITILVVFLGFVSCENPAEETDPSTLIGTWQLVERYLDPGDGSGDFQPIESDKQLIFKSNGEVDATYSICFMELSGEPGKGTYSEEDMTLKPECPEDAYFRDHPMTLDGTYLIVTYLCFEGCAEKYEKVAETP